MKTLALAALAPFAAGVVLAFALAGQEEDRIDGWIRDLGSEHRDTRMKAAEQLRNAGKAAISRLKAAANDEDAERALLARDILLWLRKPPPGESGRPVDPVPQTTLVYHDWVRGVHFRLAPDGKVELTVPESPKDPEGKRTFKTYRSDSLAKFKEEYPEVTKQYELESVAGPAVLKTEVLDWWRQTWDWLGLMPRVEEKQNGPDTMGVWVGPVGRALQSQLGLKEGEGLLILETLEGGVGAKSGLKPHDVLVQFDGKPVRADSPLRDWAKESLRKPGFPIEVVRGAKHEVLTVHAAEAK